MMLGLNRVRALIIGIKMLEARRPYDSETAHWAYSVIPRHLWLLVSASLYVQPVRASPELCCDASKMSIATLLDVGLQLIARLELSVHQCPAGAICLQLLLVR